MLAFLIGILIGSAAGVFAMALMLAASREDEWTEKQLRDRKV